MLVAIVAAPVLALPATTFEFRQASFEGHQTLEARPAAMRIQSAQQLDAASIIGAATSLTVTTHNLTSPVVAQVGANPNRDGTTLNFQTAQLSAASSFTDVDLFVSRLQDAEAPNITTKGVSASAGMPKENQVSETPYVDSTRPVASQDVSTLLALESRGTGLVRIEGSFAISFWSWNFTVASDQRDASIVTGYYRQDVVRDPLTNTDLAWNGFSQVAQVEVRNGWLEIQNAHASTLTSYASEADIAGGGSATVEGALGALAGIEAQNSRLEVDGEFEWTVRREGVLKLDLRSLHGEAAIDGRILDLGDTGPIRSNTVVRNDSFPSWAFPVGIVGLLLMAILVKGPAQLGRFNRIQHRFEAKDYHGVLRRIEPFTQRRRFERRATFLKAVSLLSLHEYQEAVLYLQTLGARQAPEPATKAFLQACAAAGQGLDSQAIKHLSDCLRDDPSYIEEAKAVPALVGYLPYFSLANAEEAAT